MQERLLIVYYGIDRLPYKDENREVHYPIVNSQSGGTLITGENNTSKIYFYVGRIGGGARQWIANIKKPDGTLSYQLCTGGQSVTLENGDNDYRVELDISSLFADQIGDVFIGLQGYSGDTVITEDDGVYEISGDPIVLATGTIKIKVNYAPNVLPKGETITPTVEQQIMAALGGKIDISSSIFVVANISTFDYSSFDDGQIFFDLSGADFYKLDNNELELVELELKDMLINGVPVTTVLASYYTKTEADQTFVKLVNLSSVVYGRNSLNQEATFGVDADNSYGQNTIVKRYNGQIVAPTPTGDQYVANKGYVDNAITEATQGIQEKADVTDIVGTYAELQSYDTSELVNGDIIKVLSDSTHDDASAYYRWVVSDNVGAFTYIGSEGPYYTQTQVNALLSDKLDKLSSNSKIYATNGSGSQTSLDYGTSANANLIVQRDSNGQVLVPTTPTSGSATSKDYVDTQDALNEKVANKVTSLSSSSTDTQYPSAKCVYDVAQHLEELANGRAKTFVLSYAETISNIKNHIEHDAYNDIYDLSGNSVIDDIANGDYDSVTLDNSTFNSNNNSIKLTNNAHYLFVMTKIANATQGDAEDIAILDTVANFRNHIKLGDNFLVIETDVPDRWVGGTDTFEITLYKLETAKIDLSGYATIDQAFNVINASDIESNTLTQAQYDLITNGKPTLIKGTFLNLINPFILAVRTTIAGGVYTRAKYIGYAPAGALQEGTIVITNATGAISLDYPATQTIDLNNISKVNDKSIPVYPSSPTTTNVLTYTTGNALAWDGAIAPIVYGKYTSDNTITTLPYDSITQLSLTANTTLSFASAPTGCYPEYRAIITNSGSSAIDITFNGIANAITNDASIVVNGNVLTLPVGITIELNICNGFLVAINTAL